MKNELEMVPEVWRVYGATVCIKETADAARAGEQPVDGAGRGQVPARWQKEEAASGRTPYVMLDVWCYCVGVQPDASTARPMRPGTAVSSNWR